MYGSPLHMRLFAVGLCQVHVFRVFTPTWTGIQLPIYLQGQAVALLELRNPEDEVTVFCQSTLRIVPEIVLVSGAMRTSNRASARIRPEVPNFCCF